MEKTMRSGNFFEVFTKVDAVREDGTTKRVKKVIAVNEFTFADAEERGIKETDAAENVEIVNINRAPYGEVYFCETDSDAEKYYKCKVGLISIDEKTVKERKSYVAYLIQAKSTNEAQTELDKIMGKSMLDYITVSIVETKISDVKL